MGRTIHVEKPLSLETLFLSHYSRLRETYFFRLMQSKSIITARTLWANAECVW